MVVMQCSRGGGKPCGYLVLRMTGQIVVLCWLLTESFAFETDSPPSSLSLNGKRKRNFLVCTFLVVRRLEMLV